MCVVINAHDHNLVDDAHTTVQLYNHHRRFDVNESAELVFAFLNLRQGIIAAAVSWIVFELNADLFPLRSYQVDTRLRAVARTVFHAIGGSILMIETFVDPECIKG